MILIALILVALTLYHDTGYHDAGYHDAGCHDTGYHDTGCHDIVAIHALLLHYRQGHPSSLRCTLLVPVEQVHRAKQARRYPVNTRR